MNALKDYGTDLTTYDPLANEEEIIFEYDLKSIKSLPKEKFDAIVITVTYTKFNEIDFITLKKENSIIYNLNNNLVDGIFN
ncbi:UDP-glucose/GDP-mannose dehydrogenase family protein [Flavobacteriaceae bacterium]|nr:UDP-glucose/GDP-mannose dehydrogenase family protein [Flavobacteriaceae bacterium]